MALNAASFNAGISKMRGTFDGMFNKMSSGISDNISKFNAYQVALDYCIAAGKKLINESKELIAISTKYDIPISQMGKLQVMANASGQSIGQLARGFRFLEMNMNKALLKPGGPQDQAFKALGVSQEDINAAAGNTALAMDIVRKKVMTIGDESRRNAFLQEIYGANWQNQLLVIEATGTSLKDAETSGYKYSTSMTQSLSGISATMEEIAQDVKPLVMPVVQVIALLVSMLGFVVEGLKLGVQLIGGALKAGFYGVLGVIQKIVGALALGWGYTQKMTANLTGDTASGQRADEIIAFGKSTMSAGDASFKSSGDAVAEMEKNRVNGRAELTKSADRMTGNLYGIGESVGLVKEGALIKDKIEDMKRLDAQIAKNEANVKSHAKAQMEVYKAMAIGKATQEDYNKAEKFAIRLANERADLMDARAAAQDSLNRAGYKAEIVVDPNAPVPMTQEERKIDLQKKRQARGRTLKEAMASTPIGQQQESAFAVVEAYEELQNLIEDRKDLEDASAKDQQKIADALQNEGMAKIKLMEKERAHELFMLKMVREREDSEKERKDNTIKAMEEREQDFMTRQGMTAMDKASVKVENAIQKMQRDEAQLQKVMDDPKRSQEERLSAQKKFEESTMGAQKEFDKLSMMQFQYSASDAAKKGMGGGMDVRENQLSVAKSSLDYLRKSYEIQLKQFGLSPDQFGNVPQQLTGPFRGGGGR
jgi:hypothetical protein